MKEIRISDFTMKSIGSQAGISLAFREKLELAKLLDRLGVSVIELEGIARAKADSLRIKSIASAVKESILAVPVEYLTRESVSETWAALKEARHPRLQVCASVSPVQMEYLFGKKPAAMTEAILDTIRACREICPDVEFLADDATRADKAFLYNIIREAIAAGAGTITLCDAAGIMLPDEFTAFLKDVYENVPALADVTLGVSISDELSMADACAVASLLNGAGEIKAASYPSNTVSLPHIAKLLASKGEENGLFCRVQVTRMNRIIEQIHRLLEASRDARTPLGNVSAAPAEEFLLSAHDDMAAVMKAVEALGYELSEEDSLNVYQEFERLSAGLDRVSSKELEAIIASAAMQVPAFYKLDSYLINTGNRISAMAHLVLEHQGSPVEGVAIGSGPIDAAFAALEQIVGRHYELDDFQIQSVTEGHEAMGQAIVKLRDSGRLFSGRGVSTDIVGASILAYLSALNKIKYEEEEA